MLLPNSDRAAIDPSKVRDYLLSRNHPLGRFKAQFFRSLGYEADRWQEFAAALREQHLTIEPELAPPMAYGQKSLIRGKLHGPSGRQAEVVRVWLVPTGKDAPRLITAYPGDSA